MAQVGTAYIPVEGDFSKFNRDTTTAVSGARKRLAGLGKAAVAGLALGGGAVIGAFAKSAISSASDINESLSKNKVLFGDSADAVSKFAETSAQKFGLSKKSALEYAGTFGNLFRAFGTGQAQAAKFSTNLTQLASDMASFNNTSIEDALEAIRSGLVGETEPLRKFGVNLNENALKAEAVASGLVKAAVDTGKVKIAQETLILAQEKYNKAVKEHGKNSEEARRANIALRKAQGGVNKEVSGSVPQLTAQQKALAAQRLIFKQTAAAHGDFGRTSKGLANQQRILGAQFDNLKAKLGAVLLPVVLLIVKAFNGLLDIFSGQGGGGFAKTISSAFTSVKDAVSSAWKSVGPDLTAIGKVIAKIATIVGKVEYAIAKRALPGIIQAFRGFGQVLKGIIEVIAGILTLRFGKVWDGIKDIFRGGIKEVLGIFRGLTAPMREIGTRIGKALAGAFRTAFHAVVQFVTDRVNDLIGAFNALPGPDLPYVGRRDAKTKAAGAVGDFGASLGAKVQERRRQQQPHHRITAGEKQARLSGLTSMVVNVTTPVSGAPDGRHLIAQLDQLAAAYG